MIDDGSTRDEFAPEEHMSIDEMPNVQDDETLRDVVAALSALPAVSEAEVQRIVQRATAGAREADRRGRRRWGFARQGSDAAPNGRRAPRPRWFGGMPLAAAAALVLAAGVGGFVLRGITAGDPAQPPGVATVPPRAVQPEVPLTTVAADPRAEAPIGTQFVLDAPDADRVALVGGFNGWDESATPLVRDPATGLWTVTVPLAPGRHVYAFSVDGALTLDPRAPSTRDAELGTSGSVILVGTP